jgi:hypothetical protein
MDPKVGLDMCEKSRPQRDSNRPARSQSLSRPPFSNYTLFNYDKFPVWPQVVEFVFTVLSSVEFESVTV